MRKDGGKNNLLDKFPHNETYRIITYHENRMDKRFEITGYDNKSAKLTPFETVCMVRSQSI